MLPMAGSVAPGLSRPEPDTLMAGAPVVMNELVWIVVVIFPFVELVPTIFTLGVVEADVKVSAVSSNLGVIAAEALRSPRNHAR